MTPMSRKTLALALVAASLGTASAQQTLTFTNTDTNATTPGNQPLSVNLVPGTAVAIAPDGNISAQCALTGSLCTGLTGGGPGPTVSLAASNFSQPLNAQNQYPPGTTFTLTPSVVGAEICVRTVSGTTPGSTNWPQTVTPPFNAQVVQLLTGESTYEFGMRCYGAGGASNAAANITVATAAGSAPGGCAGFQSNLSASWSRGALTRFDLVTAVEIGGATWQPFPNAGLSGYVITNANQYQSIGFTTPTDTAAWSAAAGLKTFRWIAAQQNGEAQLDKVYVAIASCAGDFRIPAAGSSATTDDTTFARGCRNIRALGGGAFPFQNVTYEISDLPSTDTICRLAPGRQYFINFIRANALDGSIGEPAVEASCEGNGTSCGVQMRVE